MSMDIENAIYYAPYRQLEADGISFADYAKGKNYYTQLASLFDATNPRKAETEAEANFLLSIVKQYANQENYSFLDVACGTGRHVKELTRKGHQVAGIDSSKELIDIARQSTPEATFVLADMRSFQLDESVNCIYSLWDSYTYLSRPDDMQAFADQCSARLRRGGILVLDSKNHYKQPSGVKIERRVAVVGNLRIDMLIRKETHLNDRVYEAIFTNIIQNTVTGEARVVVDQTLARIYSATDLEKSLPGFRLVNCYGDFDGSEFKTDTSERQIAVLQKI